MDQRTQAPPRPDAETAARIEARLAAELRRVDRESRCLERPVTERCPADIVDLAEAARAREALAERAEALRLRRARLIRAQERLAEGVYGRCEVCRDAISAERLEILPTTDRCAGHAHRRA